MPVSSNIKLKRLILLEEHGASQVHIHVSRRTCLCIHCLSIHHALFCTNFRPRTRVNDSSMVSHSYEQLSFTTLLTYSRIVDSNCARARVRVHFARVLPVSTDDGHLRAKRGELAAMEQQADWAAPWEWEHVHVLFDLRTSRLWRHKPHSRQAEVQRLPVPAKVVTWSRRKQHWSISFKGLKLNVE